MQAIAIENPGTDYRLCLTDRDRPEPGPGQVLIKVVAAGLNRADLLQARGKYPPPPGAPQTLGMEVSGTIAMLGKNVSGFAAGDAVCALIPGGGYAEYAIASAQCLLKLPPTLDPVAAAGLPEALFTAWTNIVDTGQLAPGETLLVHGGTSGIGSIAIQIFDALGHKIFATAGSADKCTACTNFGAARAINYEAEDFVAAVRDATDGGGVDVILDMVGGTYVQRNIAAAAQWGRIVNIAYQKGTRTEVDFAPVLTKKLTLAATTLRGRSDAEKGAIRDALLAHVWPLVAAGRVKPVIDQVFALAEADAAHRLLAKGGHIGKILLVA